MTISKQLFVNNAKTTLSTAISPTDTVLQVTDGSMFPIPNVGEFFLVTLEAGSSIEVVKVTGRTGNTFTGCVRGFEGQAFNLPSGTRAEGRATALTFSSFARKEDILDEINSVDLLDTPANSNSNSYICHSNDDAGNPIVAFKDTSAVWKFSTHRIVQVESSATSGTGTSVTSPDISTNIVRDVVNGKYIIQFFTGSNIGLPRGIISSSGNSVVWSTSLPNPVSNGDQFQIYQSDASIINELLAASDDSLIYSILLSE
jgi:hypothetical protein